MTKPAAVTEPATPEVLEAGDESDNEDDCLEDQGDGEIVQTFVEPEGEANFMTVLMNVRKLVKFFRLSPVRNNDLQQRVTLALDKEKQLSLDVKKRWNSIVSMLESVLAVKDQIIETCQELSPEISNNVDFGLVELLHNALKPFVVTVEALSRQDAMLVTADVAIMFMYRKLQEQNNPIGASEEFEGENR